MNGQYVIVNDGDRDGEDIILVVNDDQINLLTALADRDIIYFEQPEIEDLTI